MGIKNIKMTKVNKFKQVTPKTRKAKWITLATRDIKYESLTLTELKQWIKDYVPNSIKDDNIRLLFETTNYNGYYDDIIIDLEMKLQILE